MLTFNEQYINIEVDQGKIDDLSVLMTLEKRISFNM